MQQYLVLVSSPGSVSSQRTSAWFWRCRARIRPHQPYNIIAGPAKTIEKHVPQYGRLPLGQLCSMLTATCPAVRLNSRVE